MMMGNFIIILILVAILLYLNWYLYLSIRYNGEYDGHNRAVTGLIIDLSIAIYLLVELFSYLNTIKLW